MYRRHACPDREIITYYTSKPALKIYLTVPEARGNQQYVCNAITHLWLLFAKSIFYFYKELTKKHSFSFTIITSLPDFT